MITQPLFIYNADIAQSLTDLLWYLNARGLPKNYFGVNFNSAHYTDNIYGGIYPSSDWTDGTLTLQAGTFHWNNSVVNTYDGQNFGDALNNIGAAYHQIDALIHSTYTPIRVNGVNGDGTPVEAHPAQASLKLRAGQGLGFGDVLPNGRLGIPQPGNGLSETVPRAGGTAVQNCTNSALRSESVYNFRFPHFGMSGSGGDQYGFTAAYDAAGLAAMATNGARLTADISTNYTTLFSAALPSPLDVFAICAPLYLNTPQGSPGTLVYSNNFAPKDGAWFSCWYSEQWDSAFDLIWQGFAAAFSTVWEPIAYNLRDPILMCARLMTTGCTLAECLPKSATPRSCPTYAVDITTRLTVFGDPLLAPYKLQTEPHVAGAPWR